MASTLVAMRKDTAGIPAGVADGQLTYLQTDDTGRLRVNAGLEVDNVEIGAVNIQNAADTEINPATEEKQDDGNALLTTIDADTGNIATSAAVMDDWDESDRAKVNPIAGQAGVAAGAGAVDALTQRVISATDDLVVTEIGATDAAIVDAGAVGSVSAKLRRISTDLDNIWDNTSDIQVDVGSMTTDIDTIKDRTPALGTALMAASSPVTIASDDTLVTAIKTSVETLDNAISGSEMQVDVVAALPTGTNSIGQVTANAGTNLNTSLLALEAGGNLATIAGDTTSIDGKLPATIGQQLEAASLAVVLPAAQLTTLTPPAAITGFATETTLGTIDTDTGNIALAAGATTDAKADVDGNGSVIAQLRRANFGIDAIDDKTPALGQALAAASVPVVLTADQLTTITPPAAISGFALETGGNLEGIKTLMDAVDIGSGAASTGTQRILLATDDPAVALLTTMDADTGTIAGDTTSIDGKITACNTGAVVISSGSVTANAGTNLNTSALALETGGNLAAMSAKLPAALGQQLEAASMAVVLPAAQLTTLTPPAAITGFATETTLGTIDADTGSIKTNTDTLVTSGGGGYVRQDSTATIAKESGGNLAAVLAAVASGLPVLGSDDTGADAYATVATAPARECHYIHASVGTYGAIISLNGGSNDHIALPANTERLFSGLVIGSGATIQAKNLSAGNNYTALYISVW